MSQQNFNDFPQLSYPRLCGLLAQKPSRLSAAMHNAAFSACRLPFTYVAFPTTDTELGLNAMRVLGFRGLSLSLPHKEKALSLLDEVSLEARAIGAVNTVINDAGKLRGFNTDCYGVRCALEESGISGGESRVLVLGAGGAARAVIQALKEMGFSALVLSNRSAERAQALAQYFGVETLSWSELATTNWEKIDLIVNTSAIGMSPEQNESDYPFSFSQLGKTHCVFDIVTRETPLYLAARERGARVIHGSRMLLFQAVQQFELFTGESAPLAVMEKALQGEI